MKNGKKFVHCSEVLMGMKKIKGRKRHVVVDTMGNILHVFVHATNNADTSSGIVTAHAACLCYPTLKKFCADAGYITKKLKKYIV